MKANYTILCFLIFFSISLVSNAQEHNIRCRFDEYRSSKLLQNPGLDSQIKNLEQNLISKTAKFDPNKIIIIPVVVNIVHNGELIGEGRNISDSKVDEQIEILNEYFSNKNNKGVDTKIRFCLAERDVFNKPKKGINRYSTTFESFTPFNAQGGINPADGDIKRNREFEFPSSHYLNIWVADIRDVNPNSTLYGYSSFPFPIPGEEEEVEDGVVINYQNFGKGNDNVADLGLTAVHEIGHWLGLYHTFQSRCNEETDCATQGDRVCDTEPVEQEASAYLMDKTKCLEGEDCDKQTSNAVQNFMDYNFDTCYRFFTAGQVERMRDMFDITRPFIINNTAPPVACVAPDSPNGDDIPNGDASCTPNNHQDEFGYRLRRGINFGSSMDLNGNLLAVSSGAGRSYVVDIFEIEENCSVNRMTSFSSFDFDLENQLESNQYIARLGDKVKINGDRVFITGEIGFDRSNTRIPFLVIYKKESEGNYSLSQFLRINAQQLILHNNELLVFDLQTLYLYKRASNNYSLIQTLRLNFNDKIFRENRIAYNGRYVAFIDGLVGVDANAATLKVFRKSGATFNNTTIFTRNINRGGHLAFSGSNTLYVADNSGNDSRARIDLYRIGDSNSRLSNSFTLENLSNLKSRRPLLIQRINSIENLLILSRNGSGTTFHEIDGPNLNQIKNIDFLSNSSVPNALNYYENTGGFIDVNSNYGQNAVASDRFYAVSNTGCNEVYIYNLNQVLADVPQHINNSSKEICKNVPLNSLTTGTNITIGTGSALCNIEFNESFGSKSFEASGKISIKPGTFIKNGSTFFAKINPNLDCDITGGSFFNSLVGKTNSYTSKLYIYDEVSAKAKILDKTERLTENIVLYPNPTNGILGIESHDRIIKSLAVYNLNNLKIAEHLNSDLKLNLSIDLTNFSNGIYILHITLDNNEVVVKKIIKQ